MSAPLTSGSLWSSHDLRVGVAITAGQCFKRDPQCYGQIGSVLRFIGSVGCARFSDRHRPGFQPTPLGAHSAPLGDLPSPGCMGLVPDSAAWRCGAGRRRIRRDGAQITRGTTLRPYCRSHGRHARRSGKPTGALDCHAEPGKRQGRAASNVNTPPSAPLVRSVSPDRQGSRFGSSLGRHTPVVAPIARAYFFTQLGAASPD